MEPKSKRDLIWEQKKKMRENKALGIVEQPVSQPSQINQPFP